MFIAKNWKSTATELSWCGAIATIATPMDQPLRYRTWFRPTRSKFQVPTQPTFRLFDLRIICTLTPLLNEFVRFESATKTEHWLFSRRHIFIFGKQYQPLSYDHLLKHARYWFRLHFIWRFSQLFFHYVQKQFCKYVNGLSTQRRHSEDDNVIVLLRENGGRYTANAHQAL